MQQLIQMEWTDLARKRETLSAWLQLYMEVEGAAGSLNTTEAKERDLAAFLDFLKGRHVPDSPDQWTVVVTGGFVEHLREHGRSPATINRMLATLRRAATWMEQRRPFLAGHPCARVRELETEAPEWKGLSDEQIVRLRREAELAIGRGEGFPIRDFAIFLVLLRTGLRISELLALDIEQWRDKHFHNVRRKGRLVSRQVFVATDAREMLTRYVDEERGGEPGPLFCSKSGRRLVRQNANEGLKRLADLASDSAHDDILISAHVLRHTMLRRAAQKHGVAYAKEVSGHVSDRYIWRYIQPSQAEKEQALEALYDA